MVNLKFILAAASLAMLTSCGQQEAAEMPPVLTVEQSNTPEEGLDIDLWLNRLEVGSRELYSVRDEVTAALSLRPGDWVADVGAGTGLYTLLFAEVVGKNGRVFAEDIEPLFLDLINQRAADAELANITAVLGREDDVTLPVAALDAVFIADTYHYFTEREAVMRSVYTSMKPGAHLFLVEFDMKADGEMPDYKSHVRFGKDPVVRELEYIGFEFVREIVVDGLTESYFVKLRKPAEE